MEDVKPVERLVRAVRATALDQRKTEAEVVAEVETYLKRREGEARPWPGQTFNALASVPAHSEGSRAFVAWYDEGPGKFPDNPYERTTADWAAWNAGWNATVCRVTMKGEG